jgi:hypothetical protein
MLSSIQLLKAAHLSNDVYRPALSNKVCKVVDTTRKRPFLVCKDNHAQSTYVVFRGCKDINELVRCSNLKMAKLLGDAKVNETFLHFFEDVREDVFDIVKEDANHKILFTGHSAGGALAQISYAIVQPQSDNQSFSCISLGSPYVGNQGFKELIESKGNSHYRIVSRDDPVTNIKLNMELVHNGKEIIVNTKNIAKGIEHHSCHTYAAALKTLLHENNIHSKTLF